MTEDQQRRYAVAAHGVQAGTAMALRLDPSPGEPKHLRTGLDLRAADHAGLVRLLIAKGVITEDEYVEAMVKANEEEHALAEKRLSDVMGVPVTLA